MAEQDFSNGFPINIPVKQKYGYIDYFVYKIYQIYNNPEDTLIGDNDAGDYFYAELKNDFVKQENISNEISYIEFSNLFATKYLYIKIYNFMHNQFMNKNINASILLFFLLIIANNIFSPIILICIFSMLLILCQNIESHINQLIKLNREKTNFANLKNKYYYYLKLEKPSITQALEYIWSLQRNIANLPEVTGPHNDLSNHLYLLRLYSADAIVTVMNKCYFIKPNIPHNWREKKPINKNTILFKIALFDIFKKHNINYEIEPEISSNTKLNTEAEKTYNYLGTNTEVQSGYQFRVN